MIVYLWFIYSWNILGRSSGNYLFFIFYHLSVFGVNSDLHLVCLSFPSRQRLCPGGVYLTFTWRSRLLSLPCWLGDLTKSDCQRCSIRRKAGMVSAGTQTGQQSPGGGVWLITDTLEPRSWARTRGWRHIWREFFLSGHGETCSSSFLLFRPRWSLNKGFWVLSVLSFAF